MFFLQPVLRVRKCNFIILCSLCTCRVYLHITYVSVLGGVLGVLAGTAGAGTLAQHCPKIAAFRARIASPLGPVYLLKPPAGTGLEAAVHTGMPGQCCVRG